MPRLNCMLGGDMETTSGGREEATWGEEEGGALTLRALEVGGNCLEGDRGEETGEEREEVRRRSKAGEGEG